MVWEVSCFEDFEGKGKLVTYLINYAALFRKAPTVPGLLNRVGVYGSKDSLSKLYDSFKRN